MKQVCMFLLLFCLAGFRVQAQDGGVSGRYIEVTGSSSVEVDPDEICYVIRIREYWQEEFEKKKDPADYRTKVPLDEIERDLLGKLRQAGVRRDDIVVREVGNYGRAEGRDFLLAKEFELKLTDFKTVDAIARLVDTRGIDHMRIDRLKNAQIARYRLQAKAQALKAAREKAAFLLAAIDKELGEVIWIEEPDEARSFFVRGASQSNVAFDDAGESGLQNLRKISLRYEMKARFEIK